jgi:hypothetical protein
MGKEEYYRCAPNLQEVHCDYANIACFAMFRITEAGRQRLRDAARANKPWLHSTGPRTAAGKAQAALNGKLRQVDEVSVREVRGELAGLNNVIEQLASIRRQLRSDFG